MEAAPMEAYRKALRSLPKVSKEEERELWERCRRGDKDARNRLVERHIWLVVKVSWRFPTNGLARDDLVQEGFFGLLRAIEGWNPELGASFGTYAFCRIRHAIRYGILTKGHTIRPRKWEAPIIPTISISTPLTDGDDRGGTIEDHLADKVPGLDDAAEEKDAGDVLDGLPKQEAVLRRHYGIGTHERPLEEVGRELGFSRQYAHQVEKVALGRLRKKKQLRALVGCR
jgi:RNA polymerase primary sigma factor